MIDLGKKSVLGILVDAVDYESAVFKIAQAAESRVNFSVTALAVHGLMCGVLDAEHKYRLNNTDLVVPDGQPVRWRLNKIYGCELQDRVYGPQLTLDTCKEAAKRGLPIFLFGSREEVLEKLSNALSQKVPELEIAGTMASKFRPTSKAEQATIISEINSSGARLVFVGLGCPRQEVWIYEYRDKLAMPLIAVGAAFDFHAGVLPQAPAWLQKRGLEWLFRFIQEPGRLWKRYLVYNSLYLCFLPLQWLLPKLFDPTQAAVPKSEKLYG